MAKSKPNATNVLYAHHWRALELRYQGFTLLKITEQLQREFPQKHFKYNTVRYWFSVSGKLEKAYHDYARKENERRRRLATHELQKIAPQIPSILQEILERKDERGGGRKIDKILVDTLKEVNRMLGFPDEVDRHTENPIDQYFDRLDDEINKTQNPGGTPKESI